MQYDNTWIGWVKTICYPLFAAIGCVLNYLGIKHETWWILTVLMIIDTLTGIIYRLRIGVKPNSNSFKQGVTNKFIGLILVPTIALTLKPFDMDISLTVNVVLNMLILGEGFSIIGNLEAAVNKKKKVEYDALTAILSFIKSKIGDAFSALTGRKKE
jgi:phage-related holin